MVSGDFLAALQEDIESVRPKYNFKEMRDAQAEVERKIRKLKHALNVFNTTTIVPDFDMTIDEILVFLPQLNKQCSLLSGMRDAMPKVRVSSGYSGNSATLIPTLRRDGSSYLYLQHYPSLNANRHYSASARALL